MEWLGSSHIKMSKGEAMEDVKQVQYIEVGIGEQRYALKILDIQEIIKMQDITEIPSSNPYIKGVISLREKIVPIISLRNRLGLLEETYTKKTRILVVNHVDKMLGIVVDQVNQVTTFSDVQPPPEQLSNGSYITGIGHTETGLVCVLKLDQIFYK